jgi:LmbE family N-acetylglucosaminyl deacetylase
MKPTPTFPSETPGRILAFGAHPDDIEFGCGGVIARETQAGHVAHFVVGSRGEAATHGTPEQRVAEAAAGAAALGATLAFMELGGDAHFAFDLGRVLALAGIIREFRPTVVLAPTPMENQHPDHAVLGRLVRDAARLARYGGVAELRDLAPHAIGSLVYYAVTPDAEFTGRSAVLIDVSAPAVLSAWTKAMEAHQSQQATRNYVELQLARARLHGLQGGTGHAIALWPNDSLVFSSLGALGRAARNF